MSVDIWTTVPWAKEARDLAPDPASGAEITRLSASALHTFNNYLPASCSASGARCLGVRLADMLTGKTCALMAHDLVSKHTALLDDACATREQLGVPFSGNFYYVDERRQLCRVSLDTFRRETVMPMHGLPPVADVLRAITADARYLYYSTVMSTREGLTLGIVRVDLADGSWGIIYESSGFHGMVYLDGIDALVIGQRTLADGTMPPLGIWANGTNLGYHSVLVDTGGVILRDLGTPPGYNAWLPSSGQSVCNCPYDAVDFRHLPDRPEGNMLVFPSLDWKDPRVIEAPNHLFFHIARSQCERYVVSEAFRVGQGNQGPMDIVVVNVASGKSRVLVTDCGARPSGAHWQQVTPYFTAGNRYVVYNADPDGIVHVHAARIPNGFLESLD